MRNLGIYKSSQNIHLHDIPKTYTHNIAPRPRPPHVGSPHTHTLESVEVLTPQDSTVHCEALNRQAPGYSSSALASPKHSALGGGSSRRIAPSS